MRSKNGALPGLTGPEIGAQASEVRPKVGVQALRALVVDDNDVVRSVLEETLRNLGCDVISVASGEEAIAMYRPLWQVVDFVVVDMRMPGMDGYETFRALREVNPQARIVLCSGSGFTSEVERALVEGACSFLSKPLEAEKVAALVAALSQCAPVPQVARRPSESPDGRY